MINNGNRGARIEATGATPAIRDRSGIRSMAISHAPAAAGLEDGKMAIRSLGSQDTGVVALGRAALANPSAR